MSSGIGNNSFSGVQESMGSIPSAPPPPSEVKVRTLRSDLASMAKSGGGLPRFENVKVAGLSLEKGSPIQQSVRATKKSGALIGLIAATTLVLLALIGYFAYRVFFSSPTPTQPSGTQSNAAAASSTPSAPAPAPSSPPPAASGGTGTFTHASLLKTPADQTLTLSLSASSSAANAIDLQTFDQKLVAVLSRANPKAVGIEIDAKDANGNDMAFEDILAQQNANILDPAFFAAHFKPDATFFAYQDKNGFWPGYVLALNDGENWLFLKDDVARMEASQNIKNLFLQNPGQAAMSGFSDTMLNNSAARTLSFTQGTSTSYFVYGWIQSNLVLSTSINGFIWAANHLPS